MISGDSTASHMGSVKNIEKARERRTFEVMPGSTAGDLPDELQEQAQSVHPRMGYDMSDSLFMQQQQAASRDKDSKRALEEKAALEAFRAAALQKPFDPLAAASGVRGEAEAGSSSGGGGGDGKRKEPPPPPLTGIKLRKKRSSSRSATVTETAAATAVSEASSTGGGGRTEHVGGDLTATTAAGESLAASVKRSVGSVRGGEGKGGQDGGSTEKIERGHDDDDDDCKVKKGKTKQKGSKKHSKGKGKTKTGKHKLGNEASDESGEASGRGAGFGLPLVAYSSGDDDTREC